jgi:hypothetical protein
MAIGEVRPQDPNEHQASKVPNDITPPTQDHEQDQQDEQEEAQDKDQVHD